MGRIVVAAIGYARRDDLHRGLLQQHGADLHRRGVGAEQRVPPRARHVERVGVIAGRVIGRDRQRLEVVPVGLDLGAGRHLVAELGEDGRDLPPHLGEEVKVPLGERAPRQGGVDLAEEILPANEVPKARQRLLRLGLDGVLGGVDLGAELGALLGGKAPELFHHLGDAPLLAQIPGLDGADLLLGLLLGDLLGVLLPEGRELDDEGVWLLRHCRPLRSGRPTRTDRGLGVRKPRWPAWR